jgi:hypothetical protein
MMTTPSHPSCSGVSVGLLERSQGLREKSSLPCAEDRIRDDVKTVAATPCGGFSHALMRRKLMP